MKALKIICAILSSQTILLGQQSNFICGFDHQTQGISYTLNEQQLFAKQSNQNIVSRDLNLLEEDTLTIRLKLWMIKMNDGSGLGSSALSIQNINIANQNYFLQRKIKFEICQEAQINSSLYYDLDINSELDELKSTYYSKGFINLYIANSVTFSGNQAGGVGYGIGFDYDLAALNYSNSINAFGYLLFAHELAHCLHLAHTHGKYNWLTSDCTPTSNATGLNDDIWCRGAVNLDNNLNIDNNNDQVPDCMQTGDDICDTRAEPQLGIAGYVTNCQYTGNINDPNGTPYNPQVGNIMSYANIYNCNPFFTQGQFDKMRYAIENYGLQLFCQNCTESSNVTRRVVNTTEDSKVGSLRWAIECANNFSNLDTIVFSNNLLNDTLHITKPLPNLLSNLVIIGGNSNFEKFVLDGSLLTDQYACGFTFDGANISVKNFNVIDMPQKGMVGGNSCTNISIDNCEIGRSGRLWPSQFYGNGVFFNNSVNINISSTIITNSVGEGALFFNVDSLYFINNTITSSSSNGLYLANKSNYVIIKGNNIGLTSNYLPFPNNGSGIVINDTTANIQIGGDLPSEENNIANNIYQGIVIAGGSNNCNIKRNKFYCNNYWGIYREDGSNNNILPPIINNIVSSTTVSGTCPANSEVFLYKTNPNCVLCEGYEFLGSIFSVGTSWNIPLSSSLINGDRVTATATKNNNTSIFAQCKSFLCSIPTVTVSNQSICSGQSATLTANGANIYQWSNGATGSSITVSPLVTSNYTVTGSSNGCTSSPMNAQVIVFPQLNDSIFLVDNTLVSLQDGAIYQWIDCNGYNIIPNATNQTFQPTASGIYSLIISNNACSDTSNCVSFVISEVNKLTSNIFVSVFPNPSESDFIISFSSVINDGTLLIYNDIGELILKNKISNSNSSSIDFKQFPSGMYLLKIHLENNENIFKLIKK